jgi:hypothetical protein
MPFKLIKLKNKFKVQNADTGKTYSKNPISKDKAVKQMRVLNFVVKH